MKTFKIIAFLLITLSFISCQRFYERVGKNIQTKDRLYFIEQYSGGKLIKTYEFSGILNNSENSDGFYFYKSDTLIEVSGDLIIKSIKQ